MFYFLFFIAGLLISDTAYGMSRPDSPQCVIGFPEERNPMRRLFVGPLFADTPPTAEQPAVEVALGQGRSEPDSIEKYFRTVNKIINQDDSICWGVAIRELNYLICRYSRLMQQQRDLLREAVNILQHKANRPPLSYDPRIRRDVGRMPSLPESEDNAGTVVNV